MIVKSNDLSIAPIVALAGRNTKSTVKVESATSYRVTGYWSGGSKDSATFVRLADMQAVQAPGQNGLTGSCLDIPIPEGFAVVEHVMFQGKDLGYRVYLNPANFNPAMLPAATDMSERDGRILATFRAYKGGYRAPLFSRYEVTETELTALVERGYLSRNKAGAMALTVQGKIAAEGKREW